MKKSTIALLSVFGTVLVLTAAFVVTASLVIRSLL